VPDLGRRLNPNRPESADASPRDRYAGEAAGYFRIGAKRPKSAGKVDPISPLLPRPLLLFSGRHEDARRRLHRALDLNPNSEVARGYLGASYAFGGDYEAALPHLEEAIRLSPRGLLLVIWHLCKGWVALLAERYEEAIDFTEHAREANPEFPDIYAVSASAYGHLGNAAAARAALDQLLHRMPGLTASDKRLVRPFTRVGDRERFLEMVDTPRVKGALHSLLRPLLSD
jgi:tetratricopeptide (TPR) repeat protein